MDALVQGPAYPTCLGCHDARRPCVWMYCIVKARMDGVYRGACEGCDAMGQICNFAWAERDMVSENLDAAEVLAGYAHAFAEKALEWYQYSDELRRDLDRLVDDLESRSYGIRRIRNTFRRP